MELAVEQRAVMEVFVECGAGLRGFGEGDVSAGGHIEMKKLGRMFGLALDLEGVAGGDEAPDAHLHPVSDHHFPDQHDFVVALRLEFPYLAGDEGVEFFP